MEYQTWKEGQYVYTALTIALHNMWAGKKGKTEKYPNYHSVLESENPKEKKKAPVCPRSDRDYEFLARCL